MYEIKSQAGPITFYYKLQYLLIHSPLISPSISPS